MWPTPDANAVNDGENPETWRARQQRLAAKGYNGNGAGVPLAIAAQEAWPMPGANDWKGTATPGQRRGQLDEAAEQKWPTPTSGDAKASGTRSAPGSAAHPGTSLTAAAAFGGDTSGRLARKTPTDGEPTSSGGRVLNPRFVEALMGWPPRWTDCESSVTASALHRPPSPGGCSGTGSMAGEA